MLHYYEVLFLSLKDSDSVHKLIFWVLMDLLMVGIDQVEEWNCAESCAPERPLKLILNLCLKLQVRLMPNG